MENTMVFVCSVKICIEDIEQNRLLREILKVQLLKLVLL